MSTLSVFNNAIFVFAQNLPFKHFLLKMRTLRKQCLLNLTCSYITIFVAIFTLYFYFYFLCLNIFLAISSFHFLILPPNLLSLTTFLSLLFLKLSLSTFSFCFFLLVYLSTFSVIFSLFFFIILFSLFYLTTLSYILFYYFIRIFPFYFPSQLFLHEWWVIGQP